MKTFTKTLLAAVTLSAGGAASAVNVNSFTFDGSNVDIVFNAAAQSLPAGEISIITDIGSFATYCLELTQGLVVPSSYGFSPYADDLISRLVAFAGFYGGADQSTNAVDTTLEKTAFQLAIWEAVYDSDPSNLGSGIFSAVGPAGALAQANSYLTGANTLAPGSYATGNLFAFTSQNSQDLVTAVPEPSTYALMLAGLAGVGFVARRRSRHSG